MGGEVEGWAVPLMALDWIVWVVAVDSVALFVAVVEARGVAQCLEEVVEGWAVRKGQFLIYFPAGRFPISFQAIYRELLW